MSVGVETGTIRKESAKVMIGLLSISGGITGVRILCSLWALAILLPKIISRR